LVKKINLIIKIYYFIMNSIFRWLSLFTLTFVLALTFTGPALAADKMDTSGLQRVIVVFEGGLSEATQNAIVESYGGKSLKSLDLINGSVVLIPQPSVEYLENCPGVRMVDPDSIAEATLQTIPWGVDRIDAELVHPTNKGRGVKVAVIDTGVDYTHEDLDANFDPYLLGYDFVNDDSDPMDDNGHGTHVAGIIAAEENGIGVVGVAPQARLYALKALTSSGSGYYSDLIDALGWCVDHGIQVANMSLGFTSDYSPLREACDNAYNAGVLLVAAAGNQGSDSILYPAKYNSVIAVSAIDSSDNLTHKSNYGAQIELAAPGYSIKSTLMGGGYGIKSGTSIATPHVSGTAALVIASGVTGSSTVREQLDNTAEDLGAPGWDTYFGNGLVDAAAAASLPNATGNISGTVTDNYSGSPIANVTVTAGGYSTNTAYNGTYIIDDLPAGTYTVTASASSYMRESKMGVVVSKNHTITGVDFDLVRSTGAISGMVMDDGTGAPIVNATVTAGGYSTNTAYNGTYIIDNLPVGTYSVIASASSYTGKPIIGIIVSKNQTAAGIDFELVKSIGVITGTITDDGTGSPIENVRVTAGSYSTTTAPDGTYTLVDIPVGTYIVTSLASGYVDESQMGVVVRNNQVTTGINFALVKSTGTISGMVTEISTGAPIAHATITANGYSTTTADDGTYTLTDLPVGSYTITASASGYTEDFKTGVVISENQVTANVDCALTQSTESTSETGTISSTVIHDDTYADATSASGYTEDSQTDTVVSENQAATDVDLDVLQQLNENDINIPSNYFSNEKADENNLLFIILTILATPTLMAFFRKRTSTNLTSKKVPCGTYITEVTDPSHVNYIWKDTSEAENSSEQQTT